MKRNEVEAMIMEVLKQADDSDIFAIWNSYCEERNYCDDMVYNMEDLNEFFQGQDADYIICRAFYGSDEGREESSFNPNRDYFMFNGYGNLVSLDYLSFNQYSGKFKLSDFNYEVDNIIEYIIDNEDDFGIDEISEVLEMWTEEETEEA